jgi:hypothetical protein
MRSTGRYIVDDAHGVALTETANPGKPGDAKLRAYPVSDGTAARPPK